MNFVESQTKTQVILVRHGRTTYNEKGLYQGNCDDSVLTESGHHSAYQTGLFLNQFSIDAIYSSPLKRVKQTVQEIVNGFTASCQDIPPLYINDKLREIEMSVWQGLSYNYVRENFTQAYQIWKEKPHQFSFPVKGGKEKRFPVLELYARIEQFWQEILPLHQGQTLLIVSHSGTNRALISTAIGLTPESYHFLQQSNCGVSILEFIPNQTPAQLKNLNLTAHLGETLPKLKEGKQGLRLLLLSEETTESQINQLFQLLQSVSLDFVIGNSSLSSIKLAQSLLQQQPKTFYRLLATDEFKDIEYQINLWQQEIESLPTKKPCLITGLIIASATSLQTFLGKVLGNRCLSLSPSFLSIIHYPKPEQMPILQTYI